MKFTFLVESWSLKWIKFFLFMTNVMFVFTSILMISTGFAIQSVYSDFISFIDRQFYSPPLMFISVGVITLLIALLGFIGTLRESSILINIYSGLLSAVFLLEITAILFGLHHNHGVAGGLSRNMNYSIHHYPWNSHVQESVDYMQYELQCCGVNSYEDWEDVFAVIDLDSGNFRAELPNSCCSQYKESVCVPHSSGCLEKMFNLLMHCSRTIFTGLWFVAFVQISAAIYAFILAKRIRLVKTKSSLDAIKYQQTICSFDYERLHEISTENLKKPPL